MDKIITLKKAVMQKDMIIGKRLEERLKSKGKNKPMASKNKEIENRYQELNKTQSWKDILPILTEEFGVNLVLTWVQYHASFKRRQKNESKRC